MNQSPKSIRKNVFSFLIFCLGLISCQMLNLIFNSSAVINDNLVFGLVGTNLIAILVSIIAVGAIVIIAINYKPMPELLAIVLAGAVANITDRFIYGGTIDYWNLWFVPTFNLADIFIVGGTILFFCKLLFSKRY